MFKTSPLTLALVLFLVSTAVGQTARFVNKPHEGSGRQSQNESLLIVDGTTRITIPDIDHNLIAHVVHAVRKQGGDYFIVIGVRMWSRGTPVGGLCGGGEEAAVRWFHVHDGAVVEKQEALYESCIHDHEGELRGWRGSTLLVEWSDSDGHRPKDQGAGTWHMKATFDLNAPGKGLQIVNKIPERCGKNAVRYFPRRSTATRFEPSRA